MNAMNKLKFIFFTYLVFWLLIVSASMSAVASEKYSEKWQALLEQRHTLEAEVPVLAKQYPAYAEILNTAPYYLRQLTGDDFIGTLHGVSKEQAKKLISDMLQHMDNSLADLDTQFVAFDKVSTKLPRPIKVFLYSLVKWAKDGLILTKQELNLQLEIVESETISDVTGQYINVIFTVDEQADLNAVLTSLKKLKQIVKANYFNHEEYSSLHTTISSTENQASLGQKIQQVSHTAEELHAISSSLKSTMLAVTQTIDWYKKNPSTSSQVYIEAHTLYLKILTGLNAVILRSLGESIEKMEL